MPSPVDYLFTGVGSQPITLAFSYPHLLDAHEIRKSLDQVLTHFPLLQSKLVKRGANEYEYRIENEGLTFEIFDSNVSFKESKNIQQYITPVYSSEGNPLTKIALTQTPEGSVLAVSISHALVDGFSYFHFFSSWARLNRGDRILNPSIERDGILPTLNASVTEITPKMIYDDCGLFYGERRAASQNDLAREERFYLSKDAIAIHIENAKKEYPQVLFSENDILVALLWQKYLTLWGKGAQNPETFMTCPVDFRRIVKSIPKTYFGCAVCVATAALDFNHLADASLGEVALLVNKSVRRVNEEYVVGSLQTLDSLRKQKGIAEMEKLHLKHPAQGMIVTNLSRMPIRDLDFGKGGPVDFSIYVDVLGSAAILPAENGVEVIVIHPYANGGTA